MVDHARPQQRVGRVDGGGVHPDPDLPRPGVRFGKLDDPQDLGPPVPLDTYCSHDGLQYLVSRQVSD
ncbi:hypothetical protein GCM10009610_50410 [Pseudonocardia xinjiangensis]